MLLVTSSCGTFAVSVSCVFNRTRDSREAELTAREFDVLVVLIRAEGRVLTRRQIMDAAWGTEHYGTERTVDNFLAQLRAKLEDDPTSPRHLLTVRGVGYRFVP